MQVWETYQRGGYRKVTPGQAAEIVTPGQAAEIFAGSVFRLGSYGDPAAVPVSVWNTILPRIKRHSGYTHQWRNLDSKVWGFLMASVDSASEALEARSQGWRYFRVRQDDSELTDNERICPASDEGGKLIGCEACGACDGLTRGSKRLDPVIVAHGTTAQRFRASA